MKAKQILLLLSPLLLACCTNEQLVDCPREAEIAIEVVNVEGDDITEEGSVEKLSLYIFDNRKKFLKIVEAQIGESLGIYFPDQDTLHVVSWGNLGNEHQRLPQLKVGTPMSEAIIRLIETQPAPAQSRATARATARATTQATTRATTRAVVDSPDDLFYSYDVIALKTGNQTSYKLKMERSVGSMAVTMRHLQNYANRYDEDYSLVVRDTYDGIDFYGQLTGNKVGYRPATHFNEQKELMAPLFNLLPSDAEGVIEIDVYHAGMLITTVKNDNDGHTLRVLRGQVLNVLVDFRLQVSVEVSITPWGVTHMWKEF